MTDVTHGNQTKNPCCGASQAKASSSLETHIKDAYGRVAENPAGAEAGAVARGLGYSETEIESHGEGNLGLGCGNPTKGGLLKEGDRVLDLGSGAGFDALIAREAVGESGHVIGVDMTRNMLEKARRNATTQDVGANVEFREGTIEDLPVTSNSVDAVISNCVVNLSQDKTSVFEETHRVLRSGGRLQFSDILLSAPLPEALTKNIQAVVGCVGSAGLVEEYRRGLEDAGFVDVTLEQTATGACLSGMYTDPLAIELRNSLSEKEFDEAVGRVGSYRIQARKP